MIADYIYIHTYIHTSVCVFRSTDERGRVELSRDQPQTYSRVSARPKPIYAHTDEQSPYLNRA
jgi:hypothetical protein